MRPSIILFCILYSSIHIAVCGQSKQTIYDFEAISIEGDTISMNDYRDKVILIVNTASKCGYTSQYKDLQVLYETHIEDDFIILGFPCNQFGFQERGTNKEIAEFCESNYGVTFHMFSKIEVNGSDEIPLYSFLKSGFPGVEDGRVNWNFEKFLIDKSGVPVKRYRSKVKPFDFDDVIAELLQADVTKE